MTIETATNKIVVLGNGSTSVFNYGFLVKQVSHIELIYTDLLGTQTLIPSSSFSITGLNNPLGGTFTYPLSGLPIASGTSLSFRRIVPYVQGTDLENQGAFAPEVVEDALDYQIMGQQQLAEQLSRTIQLSASDTGGATVPPKAARANTVMGFDGDSNFALFSRTTGSTIPASNINTLKEIKIEDFEGYYGNFDDSSYAGDSDHVAWQSVLQAMLLDENAVFKGNGGVIYLGTNIGAFRAPPRAKFYWYGTKVFADTRPLGVYNTGGILAFNAPVGMYHRDLILNGLAQHPIASITVSGTTATVTVVGDGHGYVPGQLTGIYGVERPNGTLTTQEQILSVAEFNGLKTVLSTPTALSFTFAVAAGTPTNPVVTRARACWTKNILFGGDGLRLFNGMDCLLENVRFESINDAYCRYSGTTNDAAILATPTLPVGAFNLRMDKCHSINCTQGSSTSGGAHTVIIDNHISELSRASAWKMASRTGTGAIAGGTLHFDGIVKNSIPAALPDFNAAHPNCYSQVGVVAEGVQNLRVRGTFERVRESLNFLPNRDAGGTLPTRNLARSLDVDINIISGGDPLNLRMWDGARIEENSTQTTYAEGVKNTRVRIQCFELNGHALRVGGSNLGFNSGMDYEVTSQDCAGALALRARNGRRGRVKVTHDGAATSTANLWASGAVTYKVTEHAIVNGVKWRCDVTPGTPSTVAPTGSGTIVTADGYTWKSLHAAAALAIDADESSVPMEDMTIDAKVHNNPLGDGVYLSNLTSSNYTIVATGNARNGVSESRMTNCHAQSVTSHRNGLAQINSTGLINHNYSVLDCDSANNGFTPHTVDSFQNLVIWQRTIRNANSTGNLNLNAIRPDGFKVMMPATMINCSTVVDVNNTLGYGLKHLLDKSYLNIECPRIHDLGTANGTAGLYPGGSKLTLGSFGTVLQKGGASAGSMTHDVSVGGHYLPLANAFVAGSPPAAARIYGSNNFSAGCGWEASHNTVIGSPAVWHVVNFGEAGATGNLAAEPAANTFGIVDGGTLNTNAHWWLYLNGYKDLGSTLSPFWTTGVVVTPGTIRTVGFAITALTGNGTTATATAAGHGLSTGDKRYIARASGLFSTFNSSTQNFDLVTVTVIDANTFTYPCLATGTATITAGNTEIACLVGCYEMVAPNNRTTGATPPSGRGIVNGNYFLAFAGAGLRAVAV
jgi:hypothetical protein